MDGDILGLAGFVAVNMLAASSGAVFTPGAWYESLNKPRWRPPNWLFPPAWTVLFVTIAVAGWLVWRRAGFAGAAVPLAIYGVQLLLNAGWSACFFGLRRPDIALAEVALLWLSIVATILAFATIRGDAALLLLPYLAWVSFASVLNLAMVRLNPRRSDAQGSGAGVAASVRR